MSAPVDWKARAEHLERMNASLVENAERRDREQATEIARLAAENRALRDALAQFNHAHE